MTVSTGEVVLRLTSAGKKSVKRGIVGNVAALENHPPDARQDPPDWVRLKTGGTDVGSLQHKAT